MDEHSFTMAASNLTTALHTRIKKIILGQCMARNSGELCTGFQIQPSHFLNHFQAGIFISLHIISQG